LPNKKITVLRFLLLATLILLAIQYVLGIYVNAYVSPPYGSGALFGFHYAVGVILAGLAVVILVVSGLTRSAAAITTSAAALIFIVVAGQSGRLFSFNGQNPVYSVVMALGFLVAFASYFSEELVLRRMMTPQPQQRATSQVTQHP
jgi:hypothetical protein